MATNKAIYYATEECGQDYFFVCYVPNGFTIEKDATDIAEMCAEDYERNHDGWESSWPLKFYLREAEDGETLATVEVEREFNPCFHGSKI